MTGTPVSLLSKM